MKKIVPKEFRPFLNHIGPSAFKVIDWQSAVAKSGGLSLSYMTGRHRESTRETVSRHLPEGISFGTKGERIKPSGNRKFGEALLKLYFAQLKSPTLILDLRSDRFSQVSDEQFLWNPANLFVHLEENFRKGLTDVYKGFYGESVEKMDAGLEKMGLLKKEMDNETKESMRGLLVDHVGTQSPEATKFQMTHFESSFENFFSLLLKNKIRLPSDFMFLGVYLTILYSTLEKTDMELNVRAAWESVQ